MSEIIHSPETPHINNTYEGIGDISRSQIVSKISSSEKKFPTKLSDQPGIRAAQEWLYRKFSILPDTEKNSPLYACCKGIIDSCIETPEVAESLARNLDTVLPQLYALIKDVYQRFIQDPIGMIASIDQFVKRENGKFSEEVSKQGNAFISNPAEYVSRLIANIRSLHPYEAGLAIGSLLPASRFGKLRSGVMVTPHPLKQLQGVARDAHLAELMKKPLSHADDIRDLVNRGLIGQSGSELESKIARLATMSRGELEDFLHAERTRITRITDPQKKIAAIAEFEPWKKLAEGLKAGSSQSTLVVEHQVQKFAIH